MSTHKSTHKCIVDVAGQAWTPLHIHAKKLQQLSGLFDGYGIRWTDVDAHLVGLSLRPSISNLRFVPMVPVNAEWRTHVSTETRTLRRWPGADQVIPVATSRKHGLNEIRVLARNHDKRHCRPEAIR